MKTIILYGELAKRFGKHHRMAVKNAAEAIRALKANFKGFEAYMCGSHHHNVGFRVFMGGTSVKKYSDIHNPIGKNDIIRIVPVVMGSKSPWVQVLIGVALVAAAVVIAVGTAGAGIPLSAQILGTMGAAFIIGGVATLLTKPPVENSPSQPDLKNSYIFSGPVNVSAQGVPVPVGYGRMIVGSAVISAGIETYEEP